jgi:hypothetical protein
MKRYTTHGMATDQGRIGGLVGSAVLAQARGLPLSEVGQPKPRPYAQPVPLAALAGSEVRQHLKPKRRLPLHDWHEAAGASFVTSGLWLRPLVYSRQSGWEAVLREARAVRRSAGITEVSTLAVGRARYGIMLREDGLLFDDGTTSRLAEQHFLVTTTTANSALVTWPFSIRSVLSASRPYGAMPNGRPAASKASQACSAWRAGTASS